MRVMSMDNKRLRMGLILLTILVVMLIMSRTSKSDEGDPIYYPLRWVEDGQQHSRTFNVRKPKDMVLVREILADDVRASACVAKGDIAVEFFKERDRVTEEDHLEVVRLSWEEGKIEGGYHVYVDLQRLVRDLHRKNVKGQYLLTDPVMVWDHEVRFCMRPSERY